MLLNYHIGCFVLGSLCVGDVVQLGLSSIRVALALTCLQCHSSYKYYQIVTVSVLWNAGFNRILPFIVHL